DGRLRAKALEGPGLRQRMGTENVRERTAQFVGDLQEQRTGEAVLEIRRDEAADMGEVVPDRAPGQGPPQPVERLWRPRSVDGNGPLPVELRRQRSETGPRMDCAVRELRRRAQMDRRVVVLAQHLDLDLGQRRHAVVRHPVRDRAIAPRELLEAQALPGPLREIEKLLGIVIELVARRRRERLQRDRGPVVAAAKLVGAREMIERAPALALRQPQEAQGAMRLMMLRLERGGARERLDRLLRVTQRDQPDAAVVMRRDVSGVGLYARLPAARSRPQKPARRA